MHRALEAGLPYTRLNRSDLETPFRGVRILRDGIAPHDRDLPLSHQPPPQVSRILHLAHSYFAMDRPEDLFLSHTTAALVLGLPVALQYLDDTRIEASRISPAKRPSGRNVRGHEVLPSYVHRVHHGGLPVSDAASTWAILASRLPLPELVVLGDAIIRVPRMPGTLRDPRDRGLATLAELEAAVDVGPRPGSRLLRKALLLIRQGAASRPETLLRLHLELPGMPEPQLDHDVYDAQGRLLGCSEIAYPEFRVAVEYESEHHRVDREQWNRDIRKYSDYAAAGWEPVRITARHLFGTPPEAARLVQAALVRAGWRPRS